MKNFKITKTPHEGFDEITITNNNQEIKLLSIGASLYKWSIKQKNEWNNIVLSYKDINSYLTNDIHLGSTLGRVAGIVEGKKIKLNGKKIKGVSLDENGNLHHNGANGLHNKIWKYDTEEFEDSVHVIFSTNVDDLEDGFPGRLDTTVTYKIFSDNKIVIEFMGYSSEDTLCNLTNHTYFNLSGNSRTNILTHKIKERWRESFDTDEFQIPTTKIKIENHIDLSNPTTIANYLNNVPSFKSGINHPFKLSKKSAFILSDVLTGNKLKIKTTYPYVVINTHNIASEHELETIAESQTNMGVSIMPQFKPNDMKELLLKKDVPFVQSISYSITK